MNKKKPRNLVLAAALKVGHALVAEKTVPSAKERSKRRPRRSNRQLKEQGE